jgi:hypothetical protein
MTWLMHGKPESTEPAQSALPEQWVIVSVYRKMAPGRPVVHLYGPYPNRSRAKSAIGRMRHADRTEHGAEAAEQLTYHARKVPTDPEAPDWIKP